ncbi:MAG TPA: hypothetical protein VIF40_12010 [Methylosinus sp.]|jgi:hypothetical protein|uniref:hypothetical protein n=1 Tax=Methylosinus sp. TaxID=427 RepID=UPI002F93F8F4
MRAVIWIAVSLAALSVVGGAHAQVPAEHKNPDGGFHRRFEDADKGAKHFDDPACDVWQKPDENVAALQLPNIAPVQARPESANLPRPVDLALLVDTYHHIDNRVDNFSGRSSKPGGRLALVDFNGAAKDGPPAAHRVSLDTATEELKAAGYERVDMVDFLPRQYFAMFETSAQ